MKRSVCTPKFVTAKEVRVKQIYTSTNSGHVLLQPRIIKGGIMGYKVFKLSTFEALFESRNLGEARAYMASLNLYRV